VIDLEAVTVRYGDDPVVEDVSLSVASGELVALVGPNGAGKTSLLRTVNGLVEPAAGRVLVDGDDVAGLSAGPLARRVATVPQATSLGFDFDVRGVIEMGRLPYRSRFAGPTAADREAVDRALARTDTERFADRSVGSLSGGERQRVLLARALCQETPALVLDEPTASLDINHQVATFSLVRELVDEGRAAVAAVHDLDLAARFCDRLALLAGGRLAAAGPPRAVLESSVLERAYGVRVEVTDHPTTGAPTVTAVAGTDDGADTPGKRAVHGPHEDREGETETTAADD
jgi:iron complex transport system ATP-binding protein